MRTARWRQSLTFARLILLVLRIGLKRFLLEEVKHGD
jgi:hypothetical protein